MRRVHAVAAFALVLAVPSAFSQRGGHGGGMGHSAMGSASRGFSSHAGGMNGMHAAPMSAYHSGYHGCYNCGHNHPHSTYPYYPYRYYVNFYGRYGYRPYYAYGYYSPGWWDSSSYDDNSNYQDDAAVRQIDDLNQQVQQLREQLAAQDAQSRYSLPSPPSQATAETQPTKPVGKSADRFTASPDLATVLVFRDQRIQEIKNYAIVGKTLVVIADQRQRKIPLADLDLDKTAQLNEERGVDFQLPR